MVAYPAALGGKEALPSTNLPQGRRVVKSKKKGEPSVDYIVRHEAVQKMRVGPSESACRS